MTLPVTKKGGAVGVYVAPTVIELGKLHELTLGCDKRLGQSDGFTFAGLQIVCASP